MISKETIENLKNNGYSFEEIEGIKLGLKEANSGETLTMEEIEIFVKNDLFSKYKASV